MNRPTISIHKLAVIALLSIAGFSTRAVGQNSFPTPTGVVTVADRDGGGCCAQLQLTVNDQQTHLYEYGNGYGNGSFQIHKYGSGSANAAVFTISKTGSVGIGTTDPTLSGLVASRFTITGPDDSSTAFATGNGTTPRFALNNHSNGSWTFYDYGGNSWHAGITQLSGNVGIGKPNPTVALDVVGSINVTGTINAKYQDVAEWVPSSEQLAAGTVVVLDQTKSNQVTASTTSYDTRVGGVISAQPGITLGEKSDSKVLVATTGRVRVKVDASRGPIAIGDLLVTSDVPGVAMKSLPVEFAGRKMHMPGTIIGKALEPLEKGKGEILVLLSLQ